MPDKVWLEKFAKVRHKLDCRTDLESYFTEKEIGGTEVAAVELGTVSFPSGRVIACDPGIELGECRPYIQTVPAGKYPVTLCVELNFEKCACARVKISGAKPVRYEMAVHGNENLDGLEDGDFFGFCVDAGLACIADERAQQEFVKYWAKRLAEDADIDPYNDLFCDVLEESYERNPRYQQEGGSWALWQIPGTDCGIPVFYAGWGDGVYPVYFGYDASGYVCGVYIFFFDIEEEYAKDGDADYEKLKEPEPDVRECYWHYVEAAGGDRLQNIKGQASLAAAGFGISQGGAPRETARRIQEAADKILRTGAVPAEFDSVMEAACALGCLYGEAVCSRYGWSWVCFGSAPEKRWFGVASPGGNFCLPPLNYLYGVLSGSNFDGDGVSRNDLLDVFDGLDGIDGRPESKTYYPVAWICG